MADDVELAETPIIPAIEYGDINENTLLYDKNGVDSLLDREREAAIEREQELKSLINDNDECLDEMVTSLDPILTIGNLDEAFTLEQVKSRQDTIIAILKALREGLMD